MKILSHVIGAKKTNATFKKSDIAMDASTFSQVNLQEDGNGYYLNKSKDKVDVQISFRGETVNASVKNFLESTYQKKGGIDIQNIPLLYSLIFLNRQGDLANH